VTLPPLHRVAHRRAPGGRGLASTARAEQRTCSAARASGGCASPHEAARRLTQRAQRSPARVLRPRRRAWLVCAGAAAAPVADTVSPIRRGRALWGVACSRKGLKP
jgi:hypothetical protein